MRTLGSIIVERHGVERDAEGLSFMQRTLLGTVCHPETGFAKPIVTVMAPTGAGKSHTYRVEVAKRGGRVLFVVPTRRLAQNLMAGMRADLASGDDPWPEEKIARKVQRWTSDQSDELRDAGVRSVRDWRFVRLLALDPRAGGEIVFCTPEVLAYLVTGMGRGDGMIDAGVALIFQGFRNIVFDEFHLMDERMFALAGMLCKLAASGVFGHWTRISLLSATPIDLMPALKRIGVPVDKVEVVEEKILNSAEIETRSGRVLHGDVTVEFVEAASVTDCIESVVPMMSSVRDGGGQSMVIYNSLRSLQTERPDWQAALSRAGVPAAKILFDSSIDAQMRTDGVLNRSRDIGAMDVIVATSTIEVGVTVPRARLLVMEPGFNPAGFLQRLGRVARGSMTGHVIVVVTPDTLGRQPWLADLLGYVREQDGGRVSVLDLMRLMSRLSGIDKLIGGGDAAVNQENPENPSPLLFGPLGLRAAWTCALLWHSLVRNLWEADVAGSRDLAMRLARAAPSTYRAVYGRLAALERSTEPALKQWAGHFMQEGSRLRDIGPSTLVHQLNGAGDAISVQTAFLHSYTTLLDDNPIQADGEGRPYIVIPGTLSEALNSPDAPDWRAYTRPARLPTGGVALLGYRPLEAWCEGVEKSLGASRTIGRDEREIYRNAVDLVQWTGIIPWADAG